MARKRKNKFFKGLKRSFDKIGKGVKRGIKKIGTKINTVSKDVENAMDRAGFVSPMLNKQERIEFNRKNKGRTGAGKFLAAVSNSATRSFKNVQAPAQLIKNLDPQRNTKAGKAGFSPISLLADIALSIPSSVGVIGQSITDKKLRDKIKSGDADAISNLAFAPIGLIGPAGGSAISKGLGKAAVKLGLKKATEESVKAGTKAAAKSAAKSAAKKTAARSAGRFVKRF